jgi:hypothetical protein
VNKQIIEKCTDIYIDELGFTEQRTTIARYINELICNLTEHYEKQGVKSVSAKQDNFKHYILKPNEDGDYSLPEFLMNRLFYNVRKIEFGECGGNKGQYDAFQKSVALDMQKIRNQFHNLHDMQGDDTESVTARETAVKKVIMHEFEHALKTQFIVDGKGTEPSPQYVGLARNLRQIDKGAINLRANIEQGGRFCDSTEVHCGLHIPNGSPIADKGFRTPWDGNESHHNMDEIFNESESLVMASMTYGKPNLKPQAYKVFADRNCFPLYNLESSNFAITQFGFLLKEVIGQKESFEGMYLNPTKMFETFNKNYQDIFDNNLTKDEWRGKKPWEQLQRYIAEIKATGNEKDYLHLTNLLAQCLERKVMAEIDKTTKTDLMRTLNNFRVHSMTNDDRGKLHALPHYKILLSLKQKVAEKEEQVTR